MIVERGLAGRIAAAFVHSKLTPLFMVASMLLGAFAVLALPREEEPQIIVPMVDVFAAMPGASPVEVEQRLVRPLEKLLWEIPGVEYLYSTSSPGQAMVVVRFLVGEDEERALVRLNEKLAANIEVLPAGTPPPMVKRRSIDDVPIMALTLWGEGYDDFQLRQMAGQLHDAIKEVPNVSEVTIVGGRPRQLTVEIDPARLAAYRIDPLMVQRALESANTRAGGGDVVDRHLSARVETGGWLAGPAEVGAVVVSSRPAGTILVRDVAQITDADAEPDTYVSFTGRDGRTFPAVTISIAKRRGTNAIDIASRIDEKIVAVRGALIPSDVNVTTTRNYGETARDKSNELLWHMFLAVVSVGALIWLVLGRREAAVVLTANPVTLALTLFVFYLYGYTLNRITLFALIFSIGILVDDAIVVVENIVRHGRLSGACDRDSLTLCGVLAVDEVGNPTILATLTVVGAILPMAFVGGLMGPYMRPIPIGASAAMVFSLLVAFIVTPWAAVRLLGRSTVHAHAGEDRLTLVYRRVMGRIIGHARPRAVFFAGIAVLLAAAIVLVPLQIVTVKMLPFDNKSEFQVMVRMPEGTPLEETARATSALAARVAADEAVVNVQSYVGTSAPYNFNGLVRHYFMRRSPHLADLQVNLAPKGERAAQSHAIARRVREQLLPLAGQLGASIQVAEVPPGPPVLQTLVAEVYGPDHARRLEVARDVRRVFETTPGVVDVDWYVEAEQPKWQLVVDEEKAAAAGIAPSVVAAVAGMAGAGRQVGLLHDEHAREAVPIVLRLDRNSRRSLDAVRGIRIEGRAPIAIGELTSATLEREPRNVYHKNLQPVTYVTGDVAGSAESPVYVILQMNRALESLTLPEGYAFEIFNATQPFDTSRYAMKWDGEWHISYEVFRDLGLAFAAVLLLIYVLVVGWFQSFTTPLIIMAAIPFSLVGILPAHAAMGAFFTATSMIGFIAGAGIVVRNSIILVDFIELRLRDGMPLDQAVVDAGAVRFRPMALTAAAVIVGAGVILFDPIFQGLAISLMAGEVASLLLSRMAVPVMYFVMNRDKEVAYAS
ncbi:MAG TPA: efflux RND transporter permease subunit [Vicinamibacterales bacterium]|nr:efflux RND transporter permease subunit [Vicinamibacterales bacterium]